MSDIEHEYLKEIAVLKARVAELETERDKVIKMLIDADEVNGWGWKANEQNYDDAMYERGRAQILEHIKNGGGRESGVLAVSEVKRAARPSEPRAAAIPAAHDGIYYCEDCGEPKESNEPNCGRKPGAKA